MGTRNRSSAKRVYLIMYGSAAAAIFSGITTLGGPHSHVAGLWAIAAIVVGAVVGIGTYVGSRSR